MGLSGFGVSSPGVGPLKGRSRSTKNPSLPRGAPRDRLSCHARRPGPYPAAGHRMADPAPAADRHTEGLAPRELPDPGAAGAALVPRGGAMRVLARDAGLPISTAYRYLHEAITVLAEHAPDLHEVLEQGRREAWSHVSLDGTLIETDRV